MTKKKKILIIDDSAFMRRVLSDIMNSDPRCEVVGTARNGKEGLEKVKVLHPDVITLDIEMPIMNGLETLKALKDVRPTPVIIMSTLAKEGAKETITALEQGAVDFVTKPENIFKVNTEKIKSTLITKVLTAAQAKHQQSYHIVDRLKNQKKAVTYRPSLDHSNCHNRPVQNIVSIGCSTGGPRALQYVLPYLPKNLNAAIVIVQHMPPGFTKSLADRLNQLSHITVTEAQDKDRLINGKAFIAPGDRHMLVNKESTGDYCIRLTNDPPVGGHRPSVDSMMVSLAHISCKSLVGVIMTGMGADGKKGLQQIRQNRSIHIIAQNQETCVVYGMPKAVVEEGMADHIIPLESISDSIIKQVGVL